MKRTIQINIAGSIFFIDEDAYQKLAKYLDTIKAYLNHNKERDEIINDIEMRIAELLLEKRTSSNQAINIYHIDEVIEVMGQPEAYRIDEEEEETSDGYYKKATRKLYRDIDDRFIGGVASGLAHYFGISPLLTRLIWILLSMSVIIKIELLSINIGSAFFIYIILWIVVPAARTTSQKLQMKGKLANLSNIEKSLHREYENANNSSFKKTSANFFDWLLSVFKILLRVFIVFLSIILLLVSFTMSFILLISLFSTRATYFFPLYNKFLLLQDMHWLYYLTVNLSLFIPLIILFILSLYIINPKMKSISRRTSSGILLLWLVSIGIAGYFYNTEKNKVEIKGHYIEREDLAIKAQDTLTIKIKQHPNFMQLKEPYVLKKDEEGNYYIHSTNFVLCIHATEESQPNILIEKTVIAESSDEAAIIAEQIEYSYYIDANILELQDYFQLQNSKENKNAEIKININLPEGMFFRVEQNLLQSIQSKTCNNNLVAEELFQIKNQEIRCLNCKDQNESNTSSDWEKRVEDAFEIYQ